MILTVLIFNSAGKPRLSKFYSANSPNNRITLLNKLFNLVSTRVSVLAFFTAQLSNNNNLVNNSLTTFVTLLN
jgi:hypothetical protein